MVDVVWWLKPFYDRVLVLVLSRAVFGEATGAGDVARALPGFFRTGLVRGLTWGRFESVALVHVAGLATGGFARGRAPAAFGPLA